MNKKVIFITGASSGLGKACADYLLKKKHIIFGTSRDADFTKLKYNEYGINLLPLELQNEGSIKKAIDFVISSCGKIDVVINNAGYGFASPIEDAPIEEVRKLFAVNFLGTVSVIQQVVPIFRSQSSGLIINVSSLAGRFSLPFNGFYAGTKFALEAISESLYMELRGTNIRVVLVEPGDMFTNFTNSRKEFIKSNSYYKELFNIALNITKRDEESGADPNTIAESINKIINSKKPKFRYAVGKEVWYIVLLHSILPNKIFLYFLGHHYGL